MQWQSCPSQPLAWFTWRDLLLTFLLTPALFLSLAGCIALLLAWCLRVPRSVGLALVMLTPLSLSTIYSPVATALLSGWLQAQVPPVSLGPAGLPVAVLVGRGREVATATTEVAAEGLRQGQALFAYVSGDVRATAERLLALGVNPARVAGDSCARTTWENATRTAAWLHQNHPGAPVLLITDPWQLPRAAHAFVHQGLTVQPLAAEPALSASARNRLALRETLALLLYRAQGRI